MSNAKPLAEQLKALESLQELDLKIDQVKKRKLDLPIALKAIEDSFKASALKISQKHSFIADLEKTRRQAQGALELNRDRLTRSMAKLEAVHNSNEFNAANKEIDQIKKMGLSLEEQIKRAGEQIALVEAEIATLQASHSKVEEDRNAQVAALDTQVAALDQEIEAMRGERLPFASQVEPRILAGYDRVRGAKRGVGIAPAVGGRCTACNMMLPPQQYNEVHKGVSLQGCPSCHRILYIPRS